MSNAVKIVIGVILTIAALNNFRSAGGNPAELMGYLTATFLFLGIGLYLIYSGVSNKSGK